jgi:hypothetical protein
MSGYRRGKTGHEELRRVPLPTLWTRRLLRWRIVGFLHVFHRSSWRAFPLQKNGMPLLGRPSRFRRVSSIMPPIALFFNGKILLVQADPMGGAQ